MDDLISRQAVIVALNKQIKQCCKALGSLSLSDADKHAVEVKMASLRAHRKMLENLPTVQPEVLACGNGELVAQPSPQWIPISDRLPRDGSWNIFTDGKNISVERYKADAIDHFFPNGRWFQLEDVIAWMPLPEAYKEGGEKI